MVPVVAFIALVAASCIAVHHAQALTHVTTQQRLPAPLGHLSAVYDGEDAIYLLGGDSSISYNSAVWKYHLKDGRIDEIGTFREISKAAGAFLDGDDILFFGGYRAPFFDSNIYRFSITNNTHEHIATFPEELIRTRVAWDPTGRMGYSFGGWRYASSSRLIDEIHRYSAATDVVDKVGVFPEWKYEMAAVWNEWHQAAYLFGGSSKTDGGIQVLKFEPNADGGGNLTRLETNLATRMTEPACAAFLGDKLAYIVASHGVQRYNVVTGVAEALPIEYWPDFSFISCTFVPKMKRLYIFGGYGRGDTGLSRYRDEIAYVDL